MTFDVAQLSEDRLRVVFGLLDGDGNPLADHLEAGGELHEDQRAALLKYLRGEVPVKRSRGRPRTFTQRWREGRVRSKVLAYQLHFAVEYGSHGSLQRAYNAYQDQHPDVPIETLRKYVERNGGGLTRSELRSIDERRNGK